MKNPIPMIECDSSQIHSHGFCEDTGTLALQFKKKVDGKIVGGTVYHYHGFTPAEYKEFTEAESLGNHFGQHIKSAKLEDGRLKYPFTRIEDEKEAA